MKYRIKSGKLEDSDGNLLGTGWSGQREGYNNPAMVSISKTGPLPPGTYAIGPAYTHPHLGPVVMNLNPDPGNEMYGRDDFRIHGAAELNPELSSEGCIILPRSVREALVARADRTLEVVPE